MAATGNIQGQLAVGARRAFGVTFAGRSPFWAVMRAFLPAFLALLAVVAGSVLPFQGAINVRLRALLGHPFRASFAQFAVGAIFLGVLALTVRTPLTPAVEIARAPWWFWTGGLLGSFYVLSTIVVLPRLGGALTFALIVGGQMLAALAIDQLGLFGIERTPLSAARVLGAAMLVGAVILIRR